MQVLVTGVEGYVGSVLTPQAAGRGHEVIGVDTGYYREGWLYTARADRWRARSRIDIRHIGRETSRASTRSSTWPSCRTTRSASSSPRSPQDQPRRARCASPSSPRRGVERFVYTSSCSVYGVASGDASTRPVADQPADGLRRLQDARRARRLRTLADDAFSPTFLRNATAYGASPRMRFDIVLNNLAGLAWTTGRDHA